MKCIIQHFEVFQGKSIIKFQMCTSINQGYVIKFTSFFDNDELRSFVFSGHII